MKGTEDTRESDRYIALDIYKEYVLAGGMNTARDGLTHQQFARYYLTRLGLGHDLTCIALDPKHPRRISSEAELLALRPELKQIE